MEAMCEITELVGLDGTLRAAYERALASGASGCATALWGEPGVGKETFARLIASTSGRAFFHLRASQLSAERQRALGESDSTPFREGLVYVSEFESLDARRSRRFVERAASGELKFQVVVGLTQSYSAWLAGGARRPDERALATGFPIRIPPLRERLEDASSLASRFFSESCARLGVWREPLTADEIEKLARACAQGNLDELQRRIERVVASDVFDDGLRATFEDNSIDVAAPTGSRRAESAPDITSSDENEEFLTLDEAMKRHIEDALRRSQGAVEGKRGAARMLAINPYTLRARMRKLGIDWTRFRVEGAPASEEQ